MDFSNIKFSISKLTDPTRISKLTTIVDGTSIRNARKRMSKMANGPLVIKEARAFVNIFRSDGNWNISGLPVSLSTMVAIIVLWNRDTKKVEDYFVDFIYDNRTNTMYAGKHENTPYALPTVYCRMLDAAGRITAINALSISKDQTNSVRNSLGRLLHTLDPVVKTEVSMKAISAFIKSGQLS